MYDVYNDLEDLCEVVSREIKQANDKVRNAGGKLSSGDLEYLDKLTHMMKSIKTTMAMMEAEEDGSFDDGMHTRNMSMRHGSYARGRGRGARRDSMGRYSSRMSRNGRSYDDGFMEELHELMNEAPNESVKNEFRQFVSRIENQM